VTLQANLQYAMTNMHATIACHCTILMNLNKTATTDHLTAETLAYHGPVKTATWGQLLTQSSLCPNHPILDTLVKNHSLCHKSISHLHYKYKHITCKQYKTKHQQS